MEKRRNCIASVTIAVLIMVIWLAVGCEHEQSPAAPDHETFLAPAEERYFMPTDLHYHKGGAWVKTEGDRVRIGMTDFFQQAAGDIVYVDLPFEGDEVQQGKSFGVVQSSKWIAQLIAPLSGTIEEVNYELDCDSALINKDPYGEGWVMVVTPSNLDEEMENLRHGTEEVTTWLKRQIFLSPIASEFEAIPALVCAGATVAVIVPSRALNDTVVFANHVIVADSLLFFVSSDDGFQDRFLALLYCNVTGESIDRVSAIEPAEIEGVIGLQELRTICLGDGLAYTFYSFGDTSVDSIEATLCEMGVRYALCMREDDILAIIED